MDTPVDIVDRAHAINLNEQATLLEEGSQRCRLGEVDLKAAADDLFCVIRATLLGSALDQALHDLIDRQAHGRGDLLQG